MILPASYSNGFAPRDGQPLYPELWKGCVGAWAPCLGTTGLTLRDWSGYGNHGTLVGGTTWVNSDGRNAINYNGTTGYVSVGDVTALKLTAQISVSCWAKGTAGRYNYLVLKWGLTNDAFHLRIDNDGKPYFTTSTTGAYQAARDTIGTSNLLTGRWHHICATYDGANSRLYVNGRLEATVAATGSLFDTSMPVRLGALSEDANQSNWLSGPMDDTFIHSRALNRREIAILASRRGIAYEMAPRRRSRVAVITSGFSALRPSILRGSR